MRGRRELLELGRRPRRRHGPLSCAMLPGTSSDPPRVAFAIARQVGSAPVRNRLRRRLRAAVREHAPTLVPGASYLIGAAPEAATLPYSTLSEHVGHLLEEVRRT